MRPTTYMENYLKNWMTHEPSLNKLFVLLVYGVVSEWEFFSVMLAV